MPLQAKSKFGSMLTELKAIEMTMEHSQITQQREIKSTSLLILCVRCRPPLDNVGKTSR